MQAAKEEGKRPRYTHETHLHKMKKLISTNSKREEIGTSR
jgi:hypothetical protein